MPQPRSIARAWWAASSEASISGRRKIDGSRDRRAREPLANRAEALLAEDRQLGVQPDPIVAQSETVHDLDRLGRRRAVLLQVELHRSPRVGEPIDRVGGTERRLVSCPRGLVEAVVSEDEPAQRIAAQVDLGPSHLRSQELVEVHRVVDAVPHELDAARERPLGHELTEPVVTSRDRLVLVPVAASGRWCPRAGTGSRPPCRSRPSRAGSPVRCPRPRPRGTRDARSR